MLMNKIRSSVLLAIFLAVQGCSGGESSDSSSSTPPNIVTPPDEPSSPENGSGNVVVTNLSSQPSQTESNFFPPASFSYKGVAEIDQTITSAFTNNTYTFHVYLPPEYQQEPERQFPTLYFTDAEWYREFQYRVIDFEARPLIAVGIEHHDRRGTDYVMPGAQSYHLFLTEELIPRIESQYRVLDGERTLKGDSGGGSQTLTSMFLDDQNPPVFKYHMAFDPYIAGLGNIETLMAQRDTTLMYKTLVITGMRRGFHSTVAPFVDRLESSSLTELNVYHAVYDLDHQDATWSSFSNALEVVYGEQ